MGRLNNFNWINIKWTLKMWLQRVDNFYDYFWSMKNNRARTDKIMKKILSPEKYKELQQLNRKKEEQKSQQK